MGARRRRTHRSWPETCPEGSGRATDQRGDRVVETAGRRATQSGRQGSSVDKLVLMSKITAPKLPEWVVRRERITKLIAGGSRCPLTVVSGPPGAGKTMALALWAGSDVGTDAVAWVNLDDFDNRPRVFWSYVLAALRHGGIAVPRAMSAMVRESPIGHEFLLRLASALARTSGSATLVLDDLHLLTDPKVLDGLGYVLRNAGRGLRVVATSRMDPLLPLHRYRLSGELLEIRADDLAFTIPETRLLMAQQGIPLTAESLEYLNERTEGWAAGIRLAAISMARHPDPDQFVKMFATDESAETGYLVEEMLDAQPAPMRDLLLRTSILDRVNGALAWELTGEPSAPDALPGLARTNAFVTPVGHGWYRYNPLFAAVLRLKLRINCPSQVPELHNRAARWHRRNGSLTDAVRHAAEAADWRFAAETVVDELAVGRLIDPRGPDELLADLFQRMPQHLTRTDLQCALVDAALQDSRGETDSAYSSLAVAESLLERHSDDAQIPSRIAAALIRIGLSRHAGNIDAAAAAVAQSEALLAALPEDLLQRHPEARIQVLRNRGAVELWSGGLRAAASAFAAAAALPGSPDEVNEQADCVGKLALAEALSGRLNRATELTAVAAQGENDSDQQAEPMIPAAEVALAYVHAERNEIPLAKQRLNRAEEALRGQPNKLISAVACLIAGRCALAEGSASTAVEMTSRARLGWSPPAWLEHKLMLLESRACAARSDSQSALEAAERAGSRSRFDAAVALAYARLSGGEPHAARQALASVSANVDTPDDVRIDGWLVDAQLSYGVGEGGRGRRSLNHALRLAEPEQLRLPFAMQGGWLNAVLRHEGGLTDRYRRLLQPNLVSSATPQADAGPTAPLIVEELSGREREVLQYMSEMLNTVEIAAQMYISVNTVKTHLKSIYRKLAASQRGEAVRRARQLGLLSGSPTGLPGRTT
jgi:LuxR family transcriptional regulator, maltose regulon positive regulatory protein